MSGGITMHNEATATNKPRSAAKKTPTATKKAAKRSATSSTAVKAARAPRTAKAGTLQASTVKSGRTSASKKVASRKVASRKVASAADVTEGRRSVARIERPVAKTEAAHKARARKA
jgi:hypothetical protein